MVNCWELLQKPWIPCLGHNLNLAAKKVMSVDTISRVVAAVSRIGTNFHTSTLSANKLKEKQTLLGIPEHKLIQDVETIWNSTHDMLVQMLEQQVAVTAVMFEGSKSLKHLSLDAKQVSVTEEVVALLSSLKEITAMMSSQSSDCVTVSIIAPTLNKIERFFQTYESDYKFAILNDLGKRYKGESQSLINMAALLDPRFRTLPFLNSDQRDQIHTDMLSTLELSIIAEGNPGIKQEIEIQTPQVPSQSETVQVKWSGQTGGRYCSPVCQMYQN